MSKRIAQKVLKYTAIFEPAEEGGYIVSVPALPGCVTQGESFEEAVRMIKDAIQGYLAVSTSSLQVQANSSISSSLPSFNSLYCNFIPISISSRSGMFSLPINGISGLSFRDASRALG